MELKQVIKKIPVVYNVANVVDKNNHIRSRKLLTVMLYVTDRCNSLCKHCFIWNKKPNYDLSLDVMRNVMNSKYVSNRTVFGLEGGEFFLHPQYKEILRLFQDRDYDLLTNGILHELVIDAVREFGVKKLQISMEGTKETYKRMRGVDTYDNILKIIEAVKGKAKIKIAFTFAQWNNKEDFLHVKKLCEENDLEFLYKNIYTDMYYMDTKYPQQEILGLEEYPDEYLRLFNPWIRKEVQLPCLSINTKIAIWANGDIPLCQYKDIVLGNLYKNSFDEIWERESTKELQKKFRTCNGCWVSFHRGFDLDYRKSVEAVVPQVLHKKLLWE